MLTQSDLNKINELMQNQLKPVKKDLKKIRVDLEFVVGVLDKDRSPRAFATI